MLAPLEGRMVECTSYGADDVPLFDSILEELEQHHQTSLFSPRTESRSTKKPAPQPSVCRILLNVEPEKESAHRGV